MFTPAPPAQRAILRPPTERNCGDAWKRERRPTQGSARHPPPGVREVRRVPAGARRDLQRVRGRETHGAPFRRGGAGRPGPARHHGRLGFSGLCGRRDGGRGDPPDHGGRHGSARRRPATCRVLRAQGGEGPRPRAAHRGGRAPGTARRSSSKTPPPPGNPPWRRWKPPARPASRSWERWRSWIAGWGPVRCLPAPGCPTRRRSTWTTYGHPGIGARCEMRFTPQ